MQKEFYDRISEPFRQDTKKCTRLLRINTWITRACYIIYPAMLLYLALMRDPRIIKAFLVPFISFIAVSLFRKCFNAKRPYEMWDLAPLIPKDTKGNSFPSRHTFSIFMIAVTAGYVWGAVPGTILCLAGVFLACVRVAASVHFVKDVAAGALIAIGIGLVCYGIL